MANPGAQVNQAFEEPQAYPAAPFPSNDFLTMSYVSMSMGPDNAFKLFNIYTRSPDCRVIGIYYCPADNSYRRLMQDGVFSVPLCYGPDQKGTVIPQEMWQPSNRGDVQRHVDEAELLPPVFFVGTDHVIGINMAQVIASNPRAPLNIYFPGAPAPLGGLVTTHFCLKWPGYGEYKKQVELQNVRGAPITMAKLVERIARFVHRFIEEMATQPIEGPWRVGPGFITTQNIYIVGLLHVSRGVWQPILQLNYYILP